MYVFSSKKKDLVFYGMECVFCFCLFIVVVDVDVVDIFVDGVVDVDVVCCCCLLL